MSTKQKYFYKQLLENWNEKIQEAVNAYKIDHTNAIYAHSAESETRKVQWVGITHTHTHTRMRTRTQSRTHTHTKVYSFWAFHPLFILFCISCFTHFSTTIRHSALSF